MAITDLVQINFDLLSVCISITGIVLLGVLIYYNNPESATNRVFLAFAIVTAVWGVSNYLEYRFPTVEITLWALRIQLCIAVCHAYVFYCLAYVFPKEKVVFSARFKYVLTPLVVVVALSTLTPFVFSGIQQLAPAGQVTRATPALGIIFFVILVFGLLIAGIVSLAIKTKRAKGIERRQSLSILLGMLLMAVLLLVFNVVLPNVFSDLSFIPLAALFVVPFVALTSYAIIRQHFLNLRVVTTAILGFMVTVFTFVNILYSTSAPEIALNVTAFAIVLLGSIRIVQDTLALQLVNEERSEFMSFASHEIRNPITAMRGFASLIVDGTAGQVSDQAKDVAWKILVNGDFVLSLISEFLNKSKLELGQIAYQMVDVDVEKTIASISEGFKPHAKQNNITLELHVGYPNLIARADEAKLREVVGNLIDNSIKYTRSGGVTITTEKRNGMARIVISDTGVGIPADVVPQLFKKFSRADARKMNLLGTGLGLYLAKNFIEGMGGKVWAESDGKDKGSRFIIELHAV